MNQHIEITPGNYNDYHYITSFSGGKDSTAILIYMIKELGIEPHRINPVFANTGWEHEITYAYLDYLELALDIKINRVQGKVGQLWKKPAGLIKAIEDGRCFSAEQPLTMEILSTIKRRFPSTMVRFCTTELKLIPLKKFLDSFINPEKPIMVSGVRKEESKARSERKEWSWDSFMNTTAWLPIVEWTAKEVFDLHDKWHIEPNQLYKEGMTRVGCFPCINCVKPELEQIALRFPETFDELAAVEARVAAKSKKGMASFFPADKTPKKYHSGIGIGNRCIGYEDDHVELLIFEAITFNKALDVKAWALGQEPANSDQLELSLAEDEFWDFEGPACQSHYGLCE